MRKLIPLIFLCFAISKSYAQNDTVYFDITKYQSVNGSTIHIPVRPTAGPSFLPDENDLPCIKPGLSLNDTFYFTSLSSINIATVSSMKIDSIYLPAGLVWHTDNDSNTYSGGQSGVVVVEGTTNAPIGVYKPRVIVDVHTDIGDFLSRDLDRLLHIRYHLRVYTGYYNPCPGLDPADSSLAYKELDDSFYEEWPYDTTHTGVKEVGATIQRLSVKPNPFSGTAKVEFNSTEAGTYTMKMTNLLGAVVSSKEVEIYNGSNELMLDRNGLSSGIYIMSISNNKGAVTRKVTID